jgi:hypothetical protein
MKAKAAAEKVQLAVMWVRQVRRSQVEALSWHWWKKGLQSRFVKTINPGFRNRD